MRIFTVVLLLSVLVCGPFLYAADEFNPHKADNKYDEGTNIVKPCPPVLYPVGNWVKNTLTWVFCGYYPPDKKHDLYKENITSCNVK